MKGRRRKKAKCACCAGHEEETEDSDGTDDNCEESEDQDVPHFTDLGATDRLLSHDGSPHVTDEVFNAASHLVGGILSLLGTAVLVTGASAHANPWAIVSFSLYGASLNFLFWASFCHHAIRGSERLMGCLRKLDYVAIYFLIPGTMTPVCFVCLHSRWEGWVFFGAVWGIALFGAILQIACVGKMALPSWVSMTMYVTMGWCGAFLAIPAYECVQLTGAILLSAGGLAYTIGGVIFTLQAPNPFPGRFGFHEIWHVFVLLGAGFHWALMFFSVWPAMLAQ